MIKEELQKLVGKKFVWLTRKGNESIKEALKSAKAKGKTKVLIADQGGWITYKQYPTEFGMEIIELKTDYGIIDVKDLEEKADKDCVLLCNSMPGYIAYENMREISHICWKNGVLLVNDATGTISQDPAKVGDIIFGSFGRWKSINATFGGFIASDEDLKLEDFEFEDKKMAIISEKIMNVHKRVNGMLALAKKVKKELKSFDVIHRDEESFNVAVKFKDEDEKKLILDYCSVNSYEHVMCPKYIRVNADAVSIELKRL